MFHSQNAKVHTVPKTLYNYLIEASGVNETITPTSYPVAGLNRIVRDAGATPVEEELANSNKLSALKVLAGVYVYTVTKGKTKYKNMIVVKQSTTSN